MWLSDLSIKRPVFITMVIVALTVVGYLFYTRLPVDLFPDVAMPVVSVRTIYAGATPEEIETLVTKPIEDAVSSIGHVESVQSTSAENASIVVIQFDMEYPPQSALDDVRERVTTIKTSLPNEADDPEITRFDPSSAAILSVAVADKSDQLTPERLRRLVDSQIVPRIERVDGVAAVDVVGGRQRDIHVDLALDRLMTQLVAPQQVTAAIKAENVDVPAGRVSQADREQLLRTAGEFSSIDEIGNVPMTNLRGTTVYVKEVATVSDDYKEVWAKSRLNGRASVVINIRKQSGSNTVSVADNVKVALQSLHGEQPNLEIAYAIDQSSFTRESTQDVLISILLGGLLAAFVVLLFFRDLRNTLVTVAGLPVIVIASFGVLYVAGFTINMITLLALSISVGMLIDDAIVVRENVFRHMELGESPREAASKGTAEIAPAVLATTLTIVAVFGPVVFISGMAGRFLRDFGVTVTIAVLISLFEAFTLAPMLSAYFFRRKRRTMEQGSPQGGRLYGSLERFYRRVLGWALGHRWAVVAIAVVAFAVSAALLPMLGQSFMSDFDRGELTINLELPAGATLAETDRVAQYVENFVLRQPQAANVFTIVGSVDGAVQKASVKVLMRGRGMLDPFQREIRPMLAELSGVRYDVDLQANSIGGMLTQGIENVRGRPFQINVKGSDLAGLDQASKQIADAVSNIKGAVDVDRSMRPGKPEVDIKVDRGRAADLGVSTGMIGVTLRSLINGDIASRFRDADEQVDIVVRLQPNDRNDLAKIEQLPVISPRGGFATLGSLATLEPVAGHSQIDRLDRQRVVVVGSGYMGRELGEIYKDTQSALAKLQLPAGVSYEFAGNAKYMDEAFSSLEIALLLAVLLVYMVLASQFGSFVHPFTIMLALPLSISGAVAALLLSHRNLDMVSLIGIILLMGLVTKNSILLVDFINTNRRRGLPRNAAVLAAGPVRLRPILMTTLAMISGMLPIALGYGSGAEVRAPMAIAVIGGLITSTLLTLLVVPTVYTLIDDFPRLFGRRATPELTSPLPLVTIDEQR